MMRAIKNPGNTAWDCSINPGAAGAAGAAGSAESRVQPWEEEDVLPLLSKEGDTHPIHLWRERAAAPAPAPAPAQVSAAPSQFAPAPSVAEPSADTSLLNAELMAV